MLKSLFAVIIGGSAGCVIRWLLSIRLNVLFPNLPPGTLLVNLLGGLIIGGALAFFTRQPHLDPTATADHHRFVRWHDDLFNVFTGDLCTAANGGLFVGAHFRVGTCRGIDFDDGVGICGG